MGTHRNDVGPLPETPVEVCPGLFGGALTPMAYADGRVFVPVVELCMQESAVTTAPVLQRPPEEGTGVIAALDAATGQTRCGRGKLPSAPFGCATVAADVVFAPTYDGSDLRALGRDGGDPLERPRAGRDQRLSLGRRRHAARACGRTPSRLRGARTAADRLPALVRRIGWMAWNKR